MKYYPTLLDEIGTLIPTLPNGIAKELTNAPYFIEEFSRARYEKDKLEVIAWHLHLKKFSEVVNIYHNVNLGYEVLPPEFKIVKVVDEDRLDIGYKRHWIDCILDWEGIIFAATILYHQHDGCSDEYDEIWIYDN
jgi:hypothetical protein